MVLRRPRPLSVKPRREFVAVGQLVRLSKGSFILLGIKCDQWNLMGLITNKNWVWLKMDQLSCNLCGKSKWENDELWHTMAQNRDTLWYPSCLSFRQTQISSRRGLPQIACGHQDLCEKSFSKIVCPGAPRGLRFDDWRDPKSQSILNRLANGKITG